MMYGYRLITAAVAICAFLGAAGSAFANPELNTNATVDAVNADAAVDTDVDADAFAGMSIDTAADSPVNPSQTETELAPDKPKKDKKDKSAKTTGTETAAPTAATGKRADREVTEFRLSGTLETGFDIYNRVNEDMTESRITGKSTIEISARPVRRVRAEIGIEYDIRDTFLVVDKLYGQYSVSKPGTIRAGIMKKSFGLEERAGVEERYFHRRSIINGGIEDLGFLGHDLTLQYRHDFNKNLRATGGFSWSAEDSLRYLQNYSVSYDFAGNTQLILAAIIMHGGDELSLPASFVSSLSCKHELKLVSEAELTFGLNPSRRTQWTENRDAYIFGLRIQEQYPVNTPWSTLTQIIPLAEAAFYSEDIESENFDTQLRFGLTLGFAAKSAYQFRNTFEVRWRTLDGETNVRRYRFDSQAVVIF
ncbi:MAG: hypothetical protein FWB85_07355 [Chitinispirillia bacterium]|nr:hypothetical protein [Chitinispirillia bacterium]MCL2242064.1 hypothetical protein [Chitinispirillia bacterium]